jgi:phosphofructokinase-like protein
MEGYLGLLIGGGDCPGLNAVIRAVVRKALLENISVLGIHTGWKGFIEGDIEPLTRYSVAGLQYKGGTILGTSRYSPLATDESLHQIRQQWQKYGLEALIVVGGNGTLSASMRMWREHGYPIVGIPKTIDNDVQGTDYSFGFDTAVATATEAIDKLHTTAEAHHRVMVVEVMGRHTGWIATYAGIAGGADIVLVPEIPFRLSEICELLTKRKEMGRPFSIVVVAEDARPAPDEDFLSQEDKERIYREGYLGGIGQIVARLIQERTEFSTRVSVLGYIQRGGSPTPSDRVLATRLGVYAVEMVMRGEFGRMAALRANEIVSVALEDIADRVKRVDEVILKTASVFFG